MSNAPTFDIDLAAFAADPYPIYAAMPPIAYIPQLDATMFLKRSDVFDFEKRIDIFASTQPGGLMTRLMGENMMRKDGEPHRAERRDLFPTISPKTVRDHWTSIFRVEAERILDDIRPKGACDLTTDVAMPISGACLRAMTGLAEMTEAELDWSSQAMIDGISNHQGDPAIEARCNEGTALIDAHIDRMRGHAPNYSALTVLDAAGQSDEQVRANIKLMISGGQNEPRDAIAGAVWALLTHPDELARVQGGAVDWHRVFEEYVRWMAPIGMSPRRIARTADLGDVTVEEDDRAFLMFGAANRDPDCFDQPEKFDLTRDPSDHIAFGAGPHFCAGAWASKAMVADVALPMIFEKLPNLRIEGEAIMHGWAFRGLTTLPVAWDA